MDQTQTPAHPFRRTQPPGWWGAATTLPRPDPEAAVPEGMTTRTTRTTKPSNEDPGPSIAQAVRAFILLRQDGRGGKGRRHSGPRPLTGRAPGLTSAASMPRPTIRTDAANGYRSKRSSFVEPYRCWGQVRSVGLAPTYGCAPGVSNSPKRPRRRRERRVLIPSRSSRPSGPTRKR
jgi:hypothetical protein